MIYSILLSCLMVMSTDSLVFDFGISGNSPDWKILNDDVMGGRSTATIEDTDQYLIFRGATSLENNGGFASFRSGWSERDLSPYTEVEIRYKSEKRGFTFTLEDQYMYFRPYYSIDCPSSSEWSTITIPLNKMAQTSLGRDTGKKLDIEKLKESLRFGIMVFDKKADQFEIHIDYIKFNSSNS